MHQTRETIEKAVRLLAERLEDSQELGKPVLAHSLQVGFNIQASGHPLNLVIAGLLHDIIEDTNTTADEITELFDDNVSRIVLACTKNLQLTDNNERREDVITRSARNEDSAIVKAFDILDNYTYYSSSDDEAGVQYCIKNAEFMKRHLSTTCSDPVFTELFTLLK